MTFDELEKLEKDYISCLKSDRQKTYEINVLARENRSLRAENESLLALAKLGEWALKNRDELEVDEKSIELGLAEEVMATEPCGEKCLCNTWATFPITCLRLTDKAKVLDK